MIIATYAGTGKTTLAKLCPDTVTDLVSMPYKYELDDQDIDSEACKANPDNIMRAEWPYNYVSAIKKALGNGKIILIPSSWPVLYNLQIEKIPYVLCYPQKDAKDAYLKRFLDRGNTETFIDIFIGGWDRFMENLEKDSHGLHIVLKPHQYLSDVIDAICPCFRNNLYGLNEKETGRWMILSVKKHLCRLPAIAWFYPVCP
jgi:hypothetical protein